MHIFVCIPIKCIQKMPAGGKPLWYIQMFTTFSVLFLTFFFIGTLGSWSSKLKGIIEDPVAGLQDLHLQDSGKHTALIRAITDFHGTISGGTFYVNLLVGLCVGCAGIGFAYLLYKEKIKEVYGLIWLGAVGSFTLIWMVTTVVFYVELDETSGRIPKAFCGADGRSPCADVLPFPLSVIHKWGQVNSGMTMQGLVVWPTIAMLFLTFVAYRLHAKLAVFGNVNPDTVIATETKPGSWFDRQENAVGGTWERDPDDEALLGKDSEEPPLTEAVLVDGMRGDSMTGGWAPWLEDVFDYTF